MCRLVIALFFATGLAHAAEVQVVGLFPGKAVLVIDGATPRTYAAGDTIPGGMKLVAVSQSGATLDINGKRQVIAMGDHISRGAAGSPGKVTLQADRQGHFVTQGHVNGGSITMLVDTGATMIALSAADATRLGIDYRKGQTGTINTANGPVQAYRVRLDTVRIGDIELNQVDASVLENSMPFALLGMSFLNRTEMRQDGGQMTLTKRY
ncbi:MAG: family clan aspartic protease [Herminiimonas sp.]|nr:family clan aspartic protease [Herminiimonas sp.]